jgi:hypothetical protein
MKPPIDGPASTHFRPVSIGGRHRISNLPVSQVSAEMARVGRHIPTGNWVSWGIPFEVNRALVISNRTEELKIDAVRTRWLIFLHTSDLRPDEKNKHGFISPMRGIGKQGEHAANYSFRYEDGKVVTRVIRRRWQIGPIARPWGENCSEAVAHVKPAPLGSHADQPGSVGWGTRQTRVSKNDFGMSFRDMGQAGSEEIPDDKWTFWLWAFENPYPEISISEIHLEPINGTVVVLAITGGSVGSMPIRWDRRMKAVFRLPENVQFDQTLNQNGLLSQIQLDLGQVISAQPRRLYPNRTWRQTRHSLQPEVSQREVLIEYSAHPQACFHLGKGQSIPIGSVRRPGSDKRSRLSFVPAADQRVKIRTVDKRTGFPVPVRLHIHGRKGEYLQPLNHHRIPNHEWFEDYGTDYCHGPHTCTYIDGETLIDLPLGRVYLEVVKGFEIRPIRRSFTITRTTETIEVSIEKILPWREDGWISADTHVHFLSPATAMIEGAAEGVNLINLLASQWGELMTNVGDFDGKTTFGSKEAGGDGEHLVRVGTENRQHVLGHISLLGYNGPIIGPLCSGGPEEAAIGDPVEVLLTEWARECRRKGGLAIMPHMPQPRMENAACIVLDEIDGVEMCSWGSPYNGINPYSLSDWYRFLNNGYFSAAVAGTDKMGAGTAVGTIRTYARIPNEEGFSHDAWMAAVRRAETFVTYGPLLEFNVDGHTMGSWIHLSKTGGTVDVSWKVACVMMPMTRVELIANGEVIRSRTIRPDRDQGHWSVRIGKSTWLALMVRSKYRDKSEMIGAHSSPVMIEVAKAGFFAAADAVTILEQIEGSIAYLDTVATRADLRRYKEMRLTLESAYRRLHNRMHQEGKFHIHSHATDHPEHRKPS